MPRWRWYGWGSSPPRRRSHERRRTPRDAAHHDRGAHADLKELALRLRRRLTLKAPATKAAVKAEQEVFRLRRELQRLEVSDPDPAERRGLLPEVRRGGKVIDIGRLRRGKDPDEET